MRFLKLKFIIPSLLVLVLAIGVCLYFVGGLKASAYTYENEEYTKDSTYLFYEQLINDPNYSNRIVGNNMLVMDNEKYALVIDVRTTILTLVEKDSSWTEYRMLSGKTYATAKTDGTGAAKSNVIVKYFGSNGKESSSDLNSYDNSVNYVDTIASKTYNYYRLKLLEEGGVVTGIDILYQIGNFNNTANTYPLYFAREDFYDTFVGNLYFYNPAQSSLMDASRVYDVDAEKAYGIISENGYTGTLSDWITALNGSTNFSTSNQTLSNIFTRNPAVLYDHGIANGMSGVSFADWFSKINNFTREYNGLSAADKQNISERLYLYNYMSARGYSRTFNDFDLYVSNMTTQTYTGFLQPIEVKEADGNVARSVSGVAAYDIAVAGGYEGKAALWVTELSKLQLTYTGQGYTYSAECAAYLEESGYGVVEALDGETSRGYWTVSGLVDEETGLLKLKQGVDYNANASADGSAVSPCTTNPYILQYNLNRLLLSDNQGYKPIYPKSGTPYYDETRDPADYNLRTSDWTDKSSPMLELQAKNAGSYEALNKIMYNIDTAYINSDGVPVGNYFASDRSNNITQGLPFYYDYNGDGILSNDEIVNIGGFQAKDENGNWEYDEDGNPVRRAFSEALAMEQNDNFGLSAESVSSGFEICLRVRLSDNGLVATIINDSIVEDQLVVERCEEVTNSDGTKSLNIATQNLTNPNRIYGLTVFPYMAANSDSQMTGEIVIPDGSGATISFNSIKDKQNVSGYKKHIYGFDSTIPLTTAPEPGQYIYFGMFGYLEFGEVQINSAGQVISDTRKGLVGVVEQGANLSTIEADFLRSSSTTTTYNYARFFTAFREREEVSVSMGTTSTFFKWTSDIYEGDVTYQYLPITLESTSETLSYVNVAQTYRQYLVDKYQLEEKDTTTEHAIQLNFLGQFDKKDVKFGVVYDADMSLTTFQEAISIVKELEENGVSHFDVSYQAWTKDGMRDTITTDFNISRVLGGKKGFEELSAYLNEKAYNFYPVDWFTNGFKYDYAFGSLKYSPKSIGSTYASVVEYVVSTGLADTNSHGGFISPRFYRSLAVQFLNNFKKLDVSGIYFNDLGGMRTADYDRKEVIYTETSALLQAEVLESFSEDLNVMLYGPFDYALPYVSTIGGAPLEATMLPIIDRAIPLYHLVISGLVDYSGSAVNSLTSYSPTWYLLKAIETGSNLAFEISATDTSVLLETRYTSHYNSYYRNWKQKIIEMNEELNNLGIYESRLVWHEYVDDNVVRVRYENGLTILINFDKNIYYDVNTGLSIAANYYVVEKGAE